MWKVICSLTIMFLFAVSTAQAGVIADVHAGKVKAAVFQTEVYALPITVEGRAVYVDRCVDGIRIWYTRAKRGDDDMKDSRILRLQVAVQKYYGKKFSISTGSANCPEAPAVNRIKFTHDGRTGDRAFFNAVESALNELGIGKVVRAEE